MTKSTRKISIRLDARLHDKLQELVDDHSSRSMTAVIDKIITAGLSDGSTARAHAFLEAAVANLAVILGLLRADGNADPEAMKLVGHFYGILLEMTTAIDGVEP